MEDLFIKWGGYAGMALITALYFFFPARRKEIDSATKILVETLEKSVFALQQSDTLKEHKIQELEKNQKSNIEEIKKARQEIETIRKDRDGLKEMLEARDKNTLDFQKQCLESNKITVHIQETIKILVEGITKNNQMTEEFVKMMREHFLNVEKEAIKK